MQVFPSLPERAQVGGQRDWRRTHRRLLAVQPANPPFSKEKRSVHVGAGVVLDQLNDFLKPHGFCFGPDVATSSRATLGGMIANNSSGARCPIYGTTADHVISLEIVMQGRVEKIGPTYESLSGKRAEIEKLVRAASAAMAERWSSGLIKRWPGYGIERFLRAPNDLTRHSGWQRRHTSGHLLR